MKLFEKKRDGCRRICCFCGKKVFSYRRKNSGADVKKTDFEIFDYCKNYQYVLDLFLEERREKREESVASDYVWQYWGQGEENAPDIVKAVSRVLKDIVSTKILLFLMMIASKITSMFPILYKRNLKREL